jgi:hypothetical protein
VSFNQHGRRWSTILLIICLAAGCTQSRSNTRPTSSKTQQVSTSDTAPALSKAEYLRQANQLCAQLQDRQQQILKRLSIDSNTVAPTPDQAAAFAAEFAPAALSTFTAIGALRPPRNDADEVSQILAAYTRVIDRIATAATDHDMAVALAYAPTPWFLDAVQRGFTYGLTSCSF